VDFRSSELVPADRIRELSFGEVKRPDLLNHKTGVPEPDGLMCEKIFGPTKDYTCACGKYSPANRVAAVCEKCGVWVIAASSRAERMGHFELAMQVRHPWVADPSALMSVLPIMPAALRPMGDDVNDLYRRVINRGNRLRRLQELNAPDDITQNEMRMLQDAIDGLFDNEHLAKPFVGEDEKSLRSLGAMTLAALEAKPDDRAHLLWMGLAA